MDMNVSTIQNTKLKLYIGGKWVPPKSGKYIESFDPSTGKPWYSTPDAGPEDIDAAVRAAHQALHDKNWRRMTQTSRGGMLRKLADLTVQYADILGEIETRDNGKLLKEMVAQTRYLPEIFTYYAGIADKIEGEVIPVNKLEMLNFTMRQPLGVVGIITPWNSPLLVLAGTLGICLAIGNTVVAKPSEHTSASALAFAQIFDEADFPPGVFNVVTGGGLTAGDALARHPGIAKISFTGGTATGRLVAGAAAEHLGQTSLELGGKSPHVVFDDADIDRAASGVISGIFAAAGQSCVAGSRTFVHEKIYDDIVDRVVKAAKAIKIGDPMEEATQLGPLALKAQLEKVERYVGIGIGEGAKLAAGGRRNALADSTGGWFYEPTVFTNVKNDMRLCRDEIFGPVLAMIPFKDEQSLIAQANDSIYGLAAGIWTRDIDRAIRFANEVEAGTVWINTYRTGSFMSPMGGVKESGYGKHGGFDGIREFSSLKNVMIDYSGQTHDPFVMRMK